MSFVVESTDPHSRARAGTLQTAHGDLRTPIFMPVGTQGSVKAVPQDVLAEVVDPDIILGNTYHLYLRPGLDVLKKAGGLHGFMGWDRPILTDSGGYQVYSLAENRKIKEEGVTFRSHIDGSPHLFTPERAVDIQRVIGADIIMAFDECPPYPCDYAYARQSMELTHRWLDRCIARMNETSHCMDTSRCCFPSSRGRPTTTCGRPVPTPSPSEVPPGNAIGGLSVGEPHEEMYRSVALCTEILPEDKPRYLMGVGTPANLLENIALGVDMFDCVMPTRNARNGMLFTRQGTLNMRNRKWEDDFSPLDPLGTADVDSRYSKAYVRHLFRAREILALQIGTVHNLVFYLDLMREARERIADGTFRAWKDALVPVLTQRL